jgi:hypothetical protein
MIEDLLVGSFSEKGPVGMHAVPREKRDSPLGNMPLDVGQEAVGRLLGCHGGLNYGGRKATLAVCPLSLSTLVLERLITVRSNEQSKMLSAPRETVGG